MEVSIFNIYFTKIHFLQKIVIVETKTDTKKT